MRQRLPNDHGPSHAGLLLVALWEQEIDGVDGRG